MFFYSSIYLFIYLFMNENIVKRISITLCLCLYKLRTGMFWAIFRNMSVKKKVIPTDISLKISMHYAVNQFDLLLDFILVLIKNGVTRRPRITFLWWWVKNLRVNKKSIDLTH